MEYIKNLAHSIAKHKSLHAFFINGTFYTYADLAQQISTIRQGIVSSVPEDEKLIGLVANDDLETYAAIVALWLEAKAYIPLNPNFPIDRNLEILDATASRFVLDSSENTVYTQYSTVCTKKLTKATINLAPKPVDSTDLAYILFTSGSTGTPKGVTINFKNLNAFIAELDADPHFNINSNDRCLQMFELTFDMSVVSYLSTLLYGACAYTIPRNKIKYMYVYKLLLTQKLTVLITVPSIINYLKPYFSEINQPQVKLSCFAGGKLYDDVAFQWNQCIPKAQIINYYGPTETTIYCGYYLYSPPDYRKNKNNIVSIGKPFKNTKYLVVDKNNLPVADGLTGELAIAGLQVFPGYWKNNTQNKKSYFTTTYNGTDTLFYKSGDLCYKDPEGDYIYVGRNDFQVKIQGYRIELGEIEFYVKHLVKDANFVVLDIASPNKSTELFLIIESEPFNTDSITNYLKQKLPVYMVPGQIRFVKTIPHNINGKIDRNELRTHFKTNP